MDINEYIQSGIIESYVLGLADEEETYELEKLKPQHPEIQQAIDDFSISIEQEAFKNAVTPPADIKRRLMSELSLPSKTPVKSDAPLVVAYNVNAKQNEIADVSKKLQLWKYLAAASIILLLTSAGSNFYLYNKYSKSNTQYLALLGQQGTLQASNQIFETKLKDYERAAHMMADPGYATVQMKDPAGKQNNMTTVFWDKKTKDVYLTLNNLPKPASDKQYQLWALVDGKPVNAGVLEPGCTTLCKMKNIPFAQAFAITLEKAGGSAVPTLEQLLVLGKV